MRTWLRLTSLFGPPDPTAESSNIICDSIGLILRADAGDMVHGPMPGHLSNLLSQIAEAERELSTVSCRGVNVSDTTGPIAEISHRIPALHLGPSSPIIISAPLLTQQVPRRSGATN